MIPDDAVKSTKVVKKVKRKVGLREFNREEIAIINRRNIELIQSLKTLDSAFSMGESGQYISENCYYTRIKNFLHIFVSILIHNIKLTINVL